MWRIQDIGLETRNVKLFLLGVSHWNDCIVTSVFKSIDRLGNVVGNIKPLHEDLVKEDNVTVLGGPWKGRQAHN
jgi:hypothetical protein